MHLVPFLTSHITLPMILPKPVGCIDRDIMKPLPAAEIGYGYYDIRSAGQEWQPILSTIPDPTKDVEYNFEYDNPGTLLEKVKTDFFCTAAFFIKRIYSSWRITSFFKDSVSIGRKSPKKQPCCL